MTEVKELLRDELGDDFLNTKHLSYSNKQTFIFSLIYMDSD